MPSFRDVAYGWARKVSADYEVFALVANTYQSFDFYTYLWTAKALSEDQLTAWAMGVTRHLLNGPALQGRSQTMSTFSQLADESLELVRGNRWGILLAAQNRDGLNLVYYPPRPLPGGEGDVDSPPFPPPTTILFDFVEALISESCRRRTER